MKTRKAISRFEIEKFKTDQFQLILEVTSDFFEVSEKDLLSKSRKEEYAVPRRYVMFLAKDVFGFTYKVISKKLNRKSHGNAMSAVQSLDDERGVYPEVGRIINQLRESIRLRYLNINA